MNGKNLLLLSMLLSSACIHASSSSSSINFKIDAEWLYHNSLADAEERLSEASTALLSNDIIKIFLIDTDKAIQLSIKKHALDKKIEANIKANTKNELSTLYSLYDSLGQDMSAALSERNAKWNKVVTSNLLGAYNAIMAERRFRCAQAIYLGAKCEKQSEKLESVSEELQSVKAQLKQTKDELAIARTLRRRPIDPQAQAMVSNFDMGKFKELAQSKK